MFSNHQPAPAPDQDPIAAALWGGLSSPAVLDQNLQPANVVDALAMIAGALHDVAGALRALAADLDLSPEED